MNQIQVEPEERTFYCQVDTYLGRKDYLRGGRCVRLVGVEKADYVRLTQNEYKEGVRTFVIDIEVPSFLKRAHSKIWKQENRFHAKLMALLELKLNEESVWYEVNVEVVEAGYSYFYSTFSALPPTFFAAKTVKPARAPQLSVSPAPAQKLMGFMKATEAVRPLKAIDPGFGVLSFTAFHVGQGMCSMVHDKRHGVMFDAGAGKPVTRERYLAGLKKNELQSLVNDFKSIPYFVLSHFDNDHWNILAWDRSLRDKVRRIIVPKVKNRSARSVAFFDVEVKKKVDETAFVTIPLGGTSSVEGRRTQPSASDNNGHCLISVIDIDGRLALAAGDYVYSRMKTDTEPSIGPWAAGPYAAVIVPHHGDEASAKQIPDCTANGKAFFSAGTHDTWDHPSGVSIDNHKKKGFQTIENHTEENIIRKILI